MSADTSHTGRCFCGAVEFAVTGSPVAMGYCHCDSCRRWSAGPVNAFTLWPSAQFQLTRGDEHVGTYAHTPKTERSWCKRCGGHVFARHPGGNRVDVFAAMIPRPSVQAGSPRALPGKRVADQGRAAEDEGHAEAIRRLRGDAGRMIGRAPAPFPAKR
jgi:hypothetical protein